ncbi:anti-sigma-28 factor, FlgM [Nitrosococcus oceani ATCC 19707]|uniref:Negative regulator of flagellin synthesis n=2 Tax=Nitrosococcus oceani TaxID=1229 RepID=Q3J7Q9_NITOC|nr:flagellar biosynthesis anti-sigma factor FlgM [Nitrosococcus oceani]ABA59137.1 anti-sigma-28 factor, FlgM [Nitrosococcus oceani ATCC 19707]KFI18460.1 flagellar biosynthesis anti-sigma factor FlgM [Nitrosococcus oceani C-27]GEM20333.1 flagellar biosynthesis anti-sigma factor FlgM [Nitrosococcus oceani]
MSSEINGISGYSSVSAQKSPESVTTNPASSHPKSAGDSPTGQPAVETVTLTHTTTQLRETEASLAGISVVDNQKVEQIKQAILEGSYQIDSERIADKLIALEKSLSK